MGALDRGPGNAELVGEVANLPPDRAPAATDARLRDAGLFASGGLLVDDEIERHIFGEQSLEGTQLRVAGVRHRARQRKADGPVHTGHSQRRVLDRLHQDTTPRCPRVDLVFVEEVSRQFVNFAEVAGTAECFGVQIVRR